MNGLKGSEVSNFSIEEGTLQKIVLDNAAEKCLVSDANKFDHSDFIISMICARSTNYLRILLFQPS